MENYQVGNHDLQAIPRWATAAGLAAPGVLIGGFIAATAVQPPTYDPVRDTISQLAAHGATDPWVMTSALIGVGLCYLLFALGLRPATRAGRILLAAGGAATILIALFRQPYRGYSLGHEFAVVATALTCCTWPAFAWQRPPTARLLGRNPCFGAAAFSVGLAGWYALESHGALLGIAERCAAAAPPLWIFAVALTSLGSQLGVERAPSGESELVESRAPG